VSGLLERAKNYGLSLELDFGLVIMKQIRAAEVCAEKSKEQELF
jgi:hypothetical protein